MCENELLNVAEHEKWNILDILLNGVALFDFDIDARNERGDTLTHVLIDKNPSLLEKAIRSGADVNARDRGGKTVLHKAVQNGNQEIVSMLCNAGADVDARDTSGETPAFKAVRCGNEPGLRWLIERGTSALVLNEDKSNLLHVAAENDSTSNMVEFLVASKVDVNGRDRFDRTPLFIAFSKGNFQIARLLTRNGADVDCLRHNVLHNAVLHQQTTIVRELIEIGISVNFPDKNGETALHVAVDNDLFGMFEFLTNNGGCANAKDQDGYAPLHLAAAKKTTKFCEALLTKGALINATNLNGDSALHRAASLGNLPVVEYLLDNFAEANLQNNDGYTPLHLAVNNGQFETALCLVKHGANANVRDNFGRTSHLV